MMVTVGLCAVFVLHLIMGKLLCTMKFIQLISSPVKNFHKGTLRFTVGATGNKAVSFLGY